MNSIQQKAPHEYCDGYRDALCNRRENPQGCEMYALGYRAGFEAALTADYQARLADDLETLARADEKRGQIPEVALAFGLWHARALTVDRMGNYRVTRDGKRAVAPWNAAIRKAFRTVGDFARAAKRAEVLRAA